MPNSWTLVGGTELQIEMGNLTGEKEGSVTKWHFNTSELHPHTGLVSSVYFDLILHQRFVSLFKRPE